MSKTKLFVALASMLALTSAANAAALSAPTVTTDTATNLDISWFFDLTQAATYSESNPTLKYWTVSASTWEQTLASKKLSFVADVAAGYGKNAPLVFEGADLSISKATMFSTFDTINKVTYTLSIMQDTANKNQWDINLTGVAPVPEPETYAMFMAGLGLMGAIARRRKNA